MRTRHRRGVILWQRHVALQAVTGSSRARPAGAAGTDLVAGLNPGVKLVPAHTMMIGLVHERGFT